MTASPGSKWKGDALALAGLALAVAAFFPRVVLQGEVFFLQDVMVQNVPFRHFLHQALAEFRLPLWEPAIDCGFPLFAEGQVGALYPPNWLLAWLASPAGAVTASCLFHLWLAAAGTFAYLRALSCGRAAALTGGLAFGLGGFLVVRAMSPNYLAGAAGTPFLFLLVETGLARGRPLRLGAAGGVLALQLLAGHPQAAVYSAAAAAAYGALRSWQLGRGAGHLLLGLMLSLPGVAIAAVQLLPTRELAALSLRAEAIGVDQFASMSLPPERLLCLLLPDFFGNPSTGSYWGREAGFFIQLCPYVGVLVLALAAVAVGEGDSPVRGFFALLAVAGLALSLGRYTGWFEVLHQVPVLRQFRIPTRFLLWWAFAAAVLAGLGVERLAGTRRPLRGRWWPLWLVAGGACAAAALVNGGAFGEGWPAAAGQLVERYRHDLVGDLWRAGAALAMAGLLCAPWFRRAEAAPALTAVAAVMVTWADLRDFGGGFNAVLPPRVYQEVPGSARAVAADLDRWRAQAGAGVPPEGLVRVASLVNEGQDGYDWHSGWSRDPTSYERYPETLRMYIGGLYGLAGAQPGWSPLHLKRHWDLAAAPGTLRLANVGYVVSARPIASSDLTPIYEGPVRVYRYAAALPRAYVVPEAVAVDGDEARMAYLRSPRFDPRRQVVLDRPAPSPPSGAGGGDALAPARIASYEDRRVAVDLPGRAGYLVLADTDAPGWTALVDGRPRPILTANHAFRAVAVEAHDRRVEFRYEPRSVVVGAWISLGSALVWGLALLAVRRRRWGPAEAPREAALASAAVQLAAIVVLYGIARQTELWAGLGERLQLARVLARALGSAVGAP